MNLLSNTLICDSIVKFSNFFEGDEICTPFDFRYDENTTETSPHLVSFRNLSTCCANKRTTQKKVKIKVQYSGDLQRPAPKRFTTEGIEGLQFEINENTANSGHCAEKKSLTLYRSNLAKPVKAKLLSYHVRFGQN